jgi:hypothetical protein
MKTIRVSLISLASLAVLNLATLPAACAQDFAAEIDEFVSAGQAPHVTQVYAGHGMRRIESSWDGNITLVDLNKETVSIFNNRHPGVIQVPLKNLGDATKALLAGVNPCNVTYVSGHMGSSTCKKVGEEEVNGRSAEKYEISMTMGSMTTTWHDWIDVSLRIPVKNELNGKTGLEVRNLRETPQPANLFELPAGH